MKSQDARRGEGKKIEDTVQGCHRTFIIRIMCANQLCLTEGNEQDVHQSSSIKNWKCIFKGLAKKEGGQFTYIDYVQIPVRIGMA